MRRIKELWNWLNSSYYWGLFSIAFWVATLAAVAYNLIVIYG